MKNINFTAKSPIFLEDLDINNVLVSNKISSGEKNYKYFIGFLSDDYKIKPVHTMPSKTSVHVKSYDCQTTLTYFLIKNDDLLKKIDSKPVYNKKVFRSKIKSHADETTNFLGKEVPAEVGSDYNCLAVINLDSALKKDENCYPQVFLKERKYIEKEKSD